MDRGNLEVERKYIVSDPSFLTELDEGTGMVQGYLVDSPERTVRIRIASDGTAMLAVKGPRQGAARVELECDVPMEIGEQLLASCKALVSKTRYPVVANGRIWVVDVFHAESEGLVLAEIELNNPDEPFTKPSWCGDEVTNDDRYYNNSLAIEPFGTW